MNRIKTLCLDFETYKMSPKCWL